MNGQNDRESSIKRLYSFLLADQVLHNGAPIDIPFVEFDSIECKGVFIVALVLEENFKPIYNERGEAHAHVIMDYANANRLTHVVTTNFPVRRHARLTKSLGNVHFFRAAEIRWPDPSEAVFLPNDAAPLDLFDLLQIRPVKVNVDAYKGVTIGLLQPEVLLEGDVERTPIEYLFPMIISITDLETHRIGFRTINRWADRLSDALLL